MTAIGGQLVLVTGAGGFIGGHLCAELVRRGARVRGFVRYTSRGDRGTLDWLEPEIAREVDVVAGDLRDVEAVAGAVRGVEAVFHLGALIAIPHSYGNPRDYVETNVTGTLNVLQGARQTGVRHLVHTSTSEVYGTAQTVPITEDHPLAPQSPYAATKVAADKLVESFHRSFELPATILRPFNTYGPRQSARAVIPTIVSQALAGDIVRLGALGPRRDLVFVEDTVAGFVAAAEREAAVGAAIQLATGDDVSIGDLVALVRQVLGRDLAVEADDRRLRPPASEVQRLVGDGARARELLGWEPRTALRDGIARVVEDIEHHSERYRTGEYAT